MTLEDWLDGKQFKNIPIKLYQKKNSLQFYNNNSKDYYLDSQENKSISTNKQRKDSLNSQNKNLHNQNEFPKDRNSNYNSLENKFLKNNKNIHNNQQSTSYEKLYNQLDQDYKSLTQAYKKVINDLEKKNEECLKYEKIKNFYRNHKINYFH